MNLLIDLGNTALKWATSDDPESPHTLVHGGSHHFPDKFLSDWRGRGFRHVYGCFVASRDLTLSLTRQIESLGMQVTWLKAQDRYSGDFQLINQYKNPVQLGSDRWHAAIGAVYFMPKQPLLVVHVGTATTVDCVYPEDDNMIFAGGRIAPGVVLMRDSLVSGTATLPKADGDYADFPTDTMTAIVTGIVDSQLGLIERGMRVMHQHGFEPTLVLAGGAVGRFAPYLQKEFPKSVIKHNLVLRGLALRVASEMNQ